MGNLTQRIVMAVIGVLVVLSVVFRFLNPTDLLANLAQQFLLGALFGGFVILIAGRSGHSAA